MPTIKDWLFGATSKLSNTGVESARLDAEIILADSIKKTRTYLHAHNDEFLGTKSIKKSDFQLARRLMHEPIAYIIGYKDFYGRKFIVTPDTLIPRPESEDMIEILKEILTTNTYQQLPIKLVDIGTGSGCLGITAKLEFPFLDVILTDVSKSALRIAEKNAEKFDVKVNIINTDLLRSFANRSDIIIANLPYVDPNWERSPETNFEPGLALFANNRGLSVNKKLIAQTTEKLAQDGYLIIESDPCQHIPLIKYANKYNLKKIYLKNYIVAFKKTL